MSGKSSTQTSFACRWFYWCLFESNEELDNTLRKVYYEVNENGLIQQSNWSRYIVPKQKRPKYMVIYWNIFVVSLLLNPTVFNSLMLYGWCTKKGHTFSIEMIKAFEGLLRFHVSAELALRIPTHWKVKRKMWIPIN